MSLIHHPSKNMKKKKPTASAASCSCLVHMPSVTLLAWRMRKQVRLLKGIVDSHSFLNLKSAIEISLFLHSLSNHKITYTVVSNSKDKQGFIQWVVGLHYSTSSFQRPDLRGKYSRYMQILLKMLIMWLGNIPTISKPQQVTRKVYNYKPSCMYKLVL